jgi:hypothetical protein
MLCFVFNSLRKYVFVCFDEILNMTGATSGAGTASPSGAPEFILGI